MNLRTDSNSTFNMTYQQAAEVQEIRLRQNRHDYYEILDLPHRSSAESIRKSYKKLALRFHPDKNHLEGSKQIFSRISEAYCCLSNDKTKVSYDARYRNPGIQKPDARSKASYESQNGGRFNDWQFQPQPNDKFKTKQESDFKRQPAQVFKTASSMAAKAKQRQEFNLSYQERFKKKIREQAQEKLRKSKEQSAQNSNSRIIMAIAGFFLFYFLLMPLLSTLKRRPLYSLTPSKLFYLPMKTPTFALTYYVGDEYLSLKGASGLAEQAQLDHNINKRYIMSLKTNCRTAKKMKENFNSKALRQKSQKVRNEMIKRAQTVDTSSCEQLFGLLETHKEYLNVLGF